MGRCTSRVAGVAGVLVMAAVAGAVASAAPPAVYVATLDGDIDMRHAPFVARVVTDAAQAGAAHLIVALDRGGRKDVAALLRDQLRRAPLRTSVLVRGQTGAAGALIASGAATVAIAPGGAIDAAAAGVEAPTSVLRVADLGELVAALGAPPGDVRHEQLGPAERLVGVVTHPVLSSLLMTVAVLGILVTLRTPRAHLSGAVGLAALALFFWAHWVARLAGWEELLLVGAGVLLVAVEFFLFPGFGVAGVAGVGALLGGLTLSLVGEGASRETVTFATARVALSLALALTGALGVMRRPLERHRDAPV